MTDVWIVAFTEGDDYDGLETCLVAACLTEDKAKELMAEEIVKIGNINKILENSKEMIKEWDENNLVNWQGRNIHKELHNRLDAWNLEKQRLLTASQLSDEEIEVADKYLFCGHIIVINRKYYIQTLPIK